LVGLFLFFLPLRSWLLVSDLRLLHAPQFITHHSRCTCTCLAAPTCASQPIQLE
jgi:hypothetical protein